MKQILKTIAFGIVLGTAVFFMPFVFRFILAVMVIGFMFRMIFGHRRRRFINRFEQFSSNYVPVVPIDNQWYRPAVQSNGQVNHVNINY